MVQTLYMTDNPSVSDPPPEFYELVLKAGPSANGLVYRVTEVHGYWDDSSKAVIHQTMTLNPDKSEAYPKFSEAKERYNQQVAYRAKNGFIHSFTLDFFTGEHVHELLEVK
jgi:hypothetical protein